ncbi:MAG TPA: hypothetical protein VJN21_12635 [Candidatus Acidoferrales bacterium]|nr:hypothetical protein [Candidatus Acidoferrales bacterium]
MRKALGILSIAALAFGVQLAAAQDSSQTQSQSQSQTQTSAKPATSKPQAQKETVADAARKAQEAKTTAPKAPVVFDNDNIGAAAAGGTVNVVGSAPPARKSSDSASTEASAEGDQSAGAPGSSASSNDEAGWRARFAAARTKLAQDQEALGVMQRELQQLRLQYYPNDPQKAMKQSYSSDDVNKKQQAIDKKQKEIQADQQALSNLQDDLRKAGGDPAWARE